MMRGYYGLAPQGYGYGIVLCILGMFLLAAFIVIAVLLIIRLARSPHRTMPGEFSRPPHPSMHALEILNERLAKGEISNEEYERLKAQILGSYRQ